MRGKGLSAEARAKSAQTFARQQEERVSSVKRLGKYAVGYFDENNWVWWDATITGRAEYKFYPSFEWALRGLGTKLASDHAVRAGASLEKWLSGCEKIATSIEKGLAK